MMLARELHLAQTERLHCKVRVCDLQRPGMSERFVDSGPASEARLPRCALAAQRLQLARAEIVLTGTFGPGIEIVSVNRLQRTPRFLEPSVPREHHRQSRA